VLPQYLIGDVLDARKNAFLAAAGASFVGV
jgi:hypothetical protein